MWKRLGFLMSLIQVALAAITPAQLAFLDENSKLAAISHCNEITPPFNCTVWCADFPNITLIQKFITDDLTEIHGYLARDDTTKRIVISIRGTDSFANAVIDSLSFFTPSGKIPGCATCRVHEGFYFAWTSVEKTIRKGVAEQLALFPEYQLLITGHSVGGAVASLLGLSYQQQGKMPRVITFGQPRVGDPAFASFINSELVDAGRFIRVTHGNDPVVHLPFKNWGFQHHGGEYWIHSNDLPVSTKDINVCSNDKNSTCLEAQPFNLLNGRDHLQYFREINPKC